MDATPKRGRGTFDGWSKSSLKSLLEGCSWQWALTRLAGMEGGSTPHSAAGTGLHAAIEWHEQCRIDGRETPELWELLCEASAEAYRDGKNIAPDFAKIHGGPQQASRWACDLTVTWHDSDVRERLLGYTPLAVEPHIETERVPGPNTLRGYLDWVGRDQDGVLTVVDYKSASGLERWKNPDHHLLEAAVYLYLVSTSGYWSGDEPIRMEWHVVSRKDTAKILEGPTFDAGIIDFVYDRVSEAQAIVDGNMLSPNPSWGLCSDRWCAFYHGCQVTGILGPDHVDFNVASQRASSLRVPDASTVPAPPPVAGAVHPLSHTRGENHHDSGKE
jgi:hypothetical protein